MMMLMMYICVAVVVYLYLPCNGPDIRQCDVTLIQMSLSLDRSFLYQKQRTLRLLPYRYISVMCLMSALFTLIKLALATYLQSNLVCSMS